MDSQAYNDESSNDARGMIMTVVSASACVLGATIICVDLVTPYIPRWRTFRIQDSDSFLAASLSLSFGVMMFSSLFSILPSAKKYLLKDGYSKSTAGVIMILSFCLGAVGIAFISRFIHQFMPSHVVGCDHEHDTEHSETGSSHDHEHVKVTSTNCLETEPEVPVWSPVDPVPDEETPLLMSRPSSAPGSPSIGRSSLSDEPVSEGRILPHGHVLQRQSSVKRMRVQVMSFIADTKANCDATGPCFGFRDPCGNTCFKVREPTTKTTKNKKRRFSNTFHRTNSGMLRLKKTRSQMISRHGNRNRGLSHDGMGLSASYGSSPKRRSASPVVRPGSPAHGRENGRYSGALNGPHSHMDVAHQVHGSGHGHGHDLESQPVPVSHHHHVATTPFYAIGLQTSIAIGLHKLPEGFITYASNHANPELGFSVFIALLVHNIAEGFSLALPLYLALGSRSRAILWSALLGGLSQPLGAGMAMLWFKVVSTAPGDAAYGVLFGLTGGIMVGVGLQLFAEGLALRHDKDICLWFAFLGMALMGLSGAVVGH